MDTNQIDNLFSDTLPEDFHITNEGHLASILKCTDDVLAQYKEDGALLDLEQRALVNSNPNALAVNLVAKLALSKFRVSQLENESFVSVVFAVYKEHNRIRTQAEHPNGENFLRQKVQQLTWLFEGSKVNWELIIVDDGCPENSGGIAQEIIASDNLAANVKVLFLQDAIDQKLPLISPIADTKESRKGGSVQYGMWHAAQTERDNHYVLFTDADLSTHLGQCGLLVHELANGANAAIGSRREENSVSIKKGKRNTRGKLFIYLWQQVLPHINYITDTQCGFKGFKAEVIRQILDHTLEKQFAFDIELLVKTDAIQHQSIQKVGVAWIDSEAESTTTDLQPYLSMLNMAVKIYREYLPQDDRSDDFGAFIESLTEDTWKVLVDNVPEALAEKNPNTFRGWQEVGVSDLQAAIPQPEIEA